MTSNEQIAVAILAYMQRCGGAVYNWYVGIAANAPDRLFSGHSVDKLNDAWIFRQAQSHIDARAIEDYFHKNVGTQGGPGGGDSGTRCVYAYRIATHTVE